MFTVWKVLGCMYRLRLEILSHYIVNHSAPEEESVEKMQQHFKIKLLSRCIVEIDYCYAVYIHEGSYLTLLKIKCLIETETLNSIIRIF